VRPVSLARPEIPEKSKSSNYSSAVVISVNQHAAAHASPQSESAHRTHSRPTSELSNQAVGCTVPIPALLYCSSWASQYSSTVSLERACFGLSIPTKSLHRQEKVRRLFKVGSKNVEKVPFSLPSSSLLLMHAWYHCTSREVYTRSLSSAPHQSKAFFDNLHKMASRTKANLLYTPQNSIGPLACPILRFRACASTCKCKQTPADSEALPHNHVCPRKAAY
jgi:hypothetical protein